VKTKTHDIDLVVDRLGVLGDARDRIADSVELALRVGEGTCSVALVKGATHTFSIHNACDQCGVAFVDLSPQSFSFNSPVGMCESCNGIGFESSMDPALIVPDASLSLNEGAVVPWKHGDSTSWTWDIIRSVCKAFHIDEDTPFRDLEESQRDVLLYGTTQAVAVQWKRKRSEGVWNTPFEGIVNTLMRRYRETTSAKQRDWYATFLSVRSCSACRGGRLRQESMAVLVGGRGIVDACSDTIAQALAWTRGLDLKGNRATIGEGLIREIAGRLQFLVNVGLDYLSLNRPGPTLSGGEMQRIRLASQLGSELSGVLYVLDEPSIGLHSRDNRRLLSTLERLRDMGNSVLVVEHDAETMETADWIVDFGPGAGRLGGEIVCQGTAETIRAHPTSLTGLYLSGRREIEVPSSRRKGTGQSITIAGARENNLDDITVDLPLGTFICVTGVSGAGKSTLVNQILVPAAMRLLHRNSTAQPGEHDAIRGLEYIDQVIEIDHKPIGRTPRSNPATYVKVFDEIRSAFAGLPEARMYGYGKGRFSFNVSGGRCDACNGDGQKKIEMHFLADVYVRCEVCRGKRYNDATLKVKYRGHSIADVLGMTVDAALDLFTAVPKIHRILATLQDVGLGYIHLGQPSPTLSGGEAQRIKLSRELAKRATGHTLYVLDEPSTGLHFDDISKLLTVVNRLVDSGNTVVMIEHNLHIIKTADRILDLGPEGGAGGGEIVAQGSPEEVAEVAGSWTGLALRPVLGLE
jgi:excinuclease ABC subunit A